MDKERGIVGRKKYKYVPNFFDAVILPPVGVLSGKLKKNDMVYKGKTIGKGSLFKSCFIYDKNGEFLSLVSQSSLEKIN